MKTFLSGLSIFLFCASASARYESNLAWKGQLDFGVKAGVSREIIFAVLDSDLACNPDFSFETSTGKKGRFHHRTSVHVEITDPATKVTVTVAKRLNDPCQYRFRVMNSLGAPIYTSSNLNQFSLGVADGEQRFIQSFTSTFILEN
jgi:hypothetical protein